MEKLGYECKCLGGGKIDHNSKEKKIRVFGLSTVSASCIPFRLRVVLGLLFYNKYVCGNKSESKRSLGRLPGSLVGKTLL